MRKLPADFAGDSRLLPMAVGKISFIRLVSAHGERNSLGALHRGGKRWKFPDVRATIATKPSG